MKKQLSKRSAYTDYIFSENKIKTKLFLKKKDCSILIFRKKSLFNILVI